MLIKNIKTSLFTITLFGAILLIGCSKQDPFPSVKLPIYPNAMDVHHKIDSPVIGAKSVVYFAAIDFPAKELIEFYDREMELMGFIKYFEEGISTFKWDTYNYQSGNWEETNKVPARYRAHWVNEDKAQRVWVFIAYRPFKDQKNWENTAFVSCNMAEYFDSDTIKQRMVTEAITESHIHGNVTDASNFNVFLSRDLSEYFQMRFSKPVNVSYELLREGPTQTGIAYPKYYLWVKITDGEATIEEGAVRLAAIEKELFEIRQFLNEAEIQKDISALYKIFPESVCKKILLKLQ